MSRSVAPAFTLSREAEYTFIRGDLRRLLYTSAILAVVMVVILLVIGQ